MSLCKEAWERFRAEYRAGIPALAKFAAPMARMLISPKVVHATMREMARLSEVRGMPGVKKEMVDYFLRSAAKHLPQARRMLPQIAENIRNWTPRRQLLRI